MNSASKVIRSRCASFCALISLLACVIGCGDSGLDYAPLSGVVTMDGKPLPDAQIVLRCDDVAGTPPPACRAVSDESGAFAMKTLTPDKRLIDGAVVGTHRVAVVTEVIETGAQGQAVVARAEMLPPEVTEGKSITIDVPPSGKTDWNLAL